MIFRLQVQAVRAAHKRNIARQFYDLSISSKRRFSSALDSSSDTDAGKCNVYIDLYMLDGNY